MNDTTKPVPSVRAALSALLEAMRSGEALLDAQQQAQAALAAPYEYFGLSLDQEPKYTTCPHSGALINRETGKPIPPDEPIMIFRARDVLARQIVRRYCDLLPENAARGSGFRDSAFERAQAFNAFAEKHAHRMKKPD